MPQDGIGAPLGHPAPSLRCHGQRRHVEDGRGPPPPAGLAHLVGRRHRAALRCLGPPARARAEAAGGGGGEGRRRDMARLWVARSPPTSSARLASRRSLRRRKGAVSCRPGGASRARACPPASWWRLAPAPAPPWPTPPSSSASPLVGRSVRSTCPLSPPPPRFRLVASPQPAPATALDARRPPSRRSLAAAAARPARAGTRRAARPPRPSAPRLPAGPVAPAPITLYSSSKSAAAFLACRVDMLPSRECQILVCAE